jgi:hypothetical protein
MTGALSGKGRRLNHVEFAHRPSEGPLAVLLFEALGCTCETIDTPPYGTYVVVSLDGSPHGQNDMFASEAEPEQLALEEAMANAADGQALERFRTLQMERPYRVNHVGLRIPSVSALNETIARLKELKAGPLAGRLELGFGMEHPFEDAEAAGMPVKQLWIWTDVISTGLLALGQQIELQAYDL